MKKNIIKTIIAIGFIIALIGVIIDSFISSATLIFFNSTALYIAVAAILGTVFVFSKNATITNVGFALSAFVGVLGVIIMVSESSYFTLTVVPVGLIVMFIGAVLQYIIYAIKFFGFVKPEDAKSIGNLSETLARYKELEKEKVISEEEFNELKTKTIAMNSADKISLEDLKKWKKLLDQNIITETEFSEMKSKIFTK